MLICPRNEAYSKTLEEHSINYCAVQNIIVHINSTHIDTNVIMLGFYLKWVLEFYCVDTDLLKDAHYKKKTIFGF